MKHGTGNMEQGTFKQIFWCENTKYGNAQRLSKNLLF